LSGNKPSNHQIKFLGKGLFRFWNALHFCLFFKQRQPQNSTIQHVPTPFFLRSVFCSSTICVFGTHLNNPFFGTRMTTPKLTVDLPLDPTVMQSFAHQVTFESATRSTADLHALRSKRNAPTKTLLRHTREQRAHDALNKRLPPDADMLTYLRRLAVGNYFCVPATQAVAVRNMTYREHAERGIKYTTTKFVYGREKFLKVQRHNPIND
jgi:hypothetical protein